jgi:hypothetical protein
MLNEELLPDFDAMNTLANIIAKYKTEADSFKLQLDTRIAECVKEVYTNKNLFINGKPGTQSYVDNVVRIIGNTPEDAEALRNLNTFYRVAQRNAEEATNLLETMRNKVSVFQTISANKRNGLL